MLLSAVHAADARTPRRGRSRERARRGSVLRAVHDPVGVLVVPIYEEQLAATKRLVLRERMRVRRIGTAERQLLQDRLRRERLVVEDPQHKGRVREVYPTLSRTLRTRRTIRKALE